MMLERLTKEESVKLRAISYINHREIKETIDDAMKMKNEMKNNLHLCLSCAYQMLKCIESSVAVYIK